MENNISDVITPSLSNGVSEVPINVSPISGKSPWFYVKITFKLFR